LCSISFRAEMKQADMGSTRRHFAVELRTSAAQPVRGRMLRAEIDGEVAEVVLVIELPTIRPLIFSSRQRIVRPFPRREESKLRNSW